MDYVIGVDIGGTFTDCIVISSKSNANTGNVTIGKAPSTPPDFHNGFIDSMRAAAEQLGVSVEELASNAQGIYHGCTVGTNALVEHRTAKVGLLTTRGHRDSIFQMRSGGRLKHLPAEYVAHVAGQTKPAPLVPKQLCREIDERVAFDGNELAELNEEGARVAVQELLAEGVEAFAVSLLWSVANPAHERRLSALVSEIAPDSFVSTSSDVIPRVGEYERTVATVVNALIGPPMRLYLERLEDELRLLGYQRPVQIMTCSGGLIDSAYARTHPLLTIGSGPVAGLIGAASLATKSSSTGGSVITTDMGGTTFDVGMVYRGGAISRPSTNYDQYEYFVPTLDVRSVGAGGGSIVRVEGGGLRVGPRSAGARPGPACYLKGGTEATVTDANVVLGYLNPTYFLGGAITLDVPAAEAALLEAGRPLGFTAEQTAAAAARIVDNQMADAIRFASVQQGYDPRDFELYAFGGGGPAHATALARELEMTRVVVPLSDFSSGWSAFGVASSDALVVKELAVGMSSPFDPDALNDLWTLLEREVEERLVAQGIPPERVRLDRTVDMRYSQQVNQIPVDAPEGTYDDVTVKSLIGEFEREYERLFGAGSGYADAGIALTSVRVHGRAAISGYSLSPLEESRSAGSPTVKGERAVIWYERGGDREVTTVYEGPSFRPGMSVEGPAIIEYPVTTVVLRYGDVATVDEFGSVLIDVR